MTARDSYPAAARYADPLASRDRHTMDSRQHQRVAEQVGWMLNEIDTLRDEVARLRELVP